MPAKAARRLGKQRVAAAEAAAVARAAAVVVAQAAQPRVDALIERELDLLCRRLGGLEGGARCEREAVIRPLEWRALGPDKLRARGRGARRAVGMRADADIVDGRPARLRLADGTCAPCFLLLMPGGERCLAVQCCSRRHLAC